MPAACRNERLLRRQQSSIATRLFSLPGKFRAKAHKPPSASRARVDGITELTGMLPVNPVIMSSLFRGALGGDDEDDCVPGWANVERADDHRFRFAHADVGGDTGALVINSRSNG